MIYRQAGARDAQAIADIINQIVRDTTITFTTDLKTADGIAAQIAEHGPAYLVAEAEGQVLGVASYGPFRPGPGYRFAKEHSIVLAPAARGRGVGRGLMAALEEVATRQGVTSLWAGVSGENSAGVAFHAALGFEQVAVLPRVGFKFDRWQDLVLMVKRLDGSG